VKKASAYNNYTQESGPMVMRNYCRNGTARFKKCKQLFEYQHLLYLETSGGQSSNLYFNVVPFFIASVN
jgi:hypothetical protein